jgi:acetyl-CoA carboxylase beta subunit
MNQTATKEREFHYENAMCEAAGLRTSCNSCDRIIYKDEFNPETYYPLGYCPECAEEAEMESTKQ